MAEANDELYRQNRLKADAVAVPPEDRPKLFIVADAVSGTGDGSKDYPNKPVSAAQLENILAMEAQLGINTLQLIFMGGQTERVKSEAAKKGITRFRIAIASPAGPGFFSWWTKYFTPAAINKFVDTRVAETLASPSGQYNWQRQFGWMPEDVVLFHMLDEPGWYYPEIISTVNSDPGAPTLFRTYLQSKGFTPGTFGKVSWSDVSVIAQSKAVDLPSRRLFYHTVKFINDGAASGMAQIKTALLKKFPNALVGCNYNNFPNRAYLPSPNQQMAQMNGPDAAYSGPDWGDFGRTGSVGVQWSEDWFHDKEAEYWAGRTDMLRSAARGSGQLCGGYIVGLMLRLPIGGKFKALAMIAHGAKAIEWYVHGPVFAGNAWAGNTAAYAAIANANRLIGRSEDLLFPAQVPKSKVAILQGQSAHIWNVKNTGVPVMNRTNWEAEAEYIPFALHHSGYSVDYLDETDIEQGKLADYKALYVTAPNVSSVAQTVIRAWIGAGGVAQFSPGACAADEYDTPVHILDAAMGITNNVIDRRCGSEDPNVARTIKYLNLPLAPGVFLASPNSIGDMRAQTVGLSLTTAQKLAEYTNDKSAAASINNHGAGKAICLGYWNAQRYYGLSFALAYTTFPAYWDADMRSVSTVGPRAAGVVKPAVASVPCLEAARLDGEKGICVVLLNWTDKTQSGFTVTVNDIDPSRIDRIVLAGSGQSLQWTSSGRSITFTIPQLGVDVDVAKLYFSTSTPVVIHPLSPALANAVTAFKAAPATLNTAFLQFCADKGLNPAEWQFNADYSAVIRK